MANQLPRDVGSLPKWAQLLIDHLLGLPQTANGYCPDCGYPTAEGYICFCGYEVGDIAETSNRFEGMDL